MDEERAVCGNCGRALESDARFCSHCGWPAPRPEEPMWGDADTEVLRRAFDRDEQGELEHGQGARHPRVSVLRSDGLMLFTVDVPHDRPLSIGRGSDQDIRLLDLTVSRAHAVIQPVEGRFVIRDMGSTNATLLNGEPIGEQQVLFDGAEIRIGTHTLVFQDG